MSKLVEHKEMIHVGTEIVILAGVSYYFYNRTNKLRIRVDELEKALSNQNEIIAKHGEYITALSQQLESTQRMVMSVQQGVNQPTPRPSSNRPTPVPVPKKRASPRPPVNIVMTQPKKIEQIEEISSDEESDVDAEIEEELKELDN